MATSRSTSPIHPFKNDERVHLPLVGKVHSDRMHLLLFDATDDDPSAGSPTETLLRLLLPLNDQV